MNNPNMENQIKELMELKRMREELDNEIQAAEDAIKQVREHHTGLPHWSS